jgi:enolase
MRHFYPETESPLAMIEARMQAQELVLQCLCKAVASIDARSGQAIALALEVAEEEQAELRGSDDEIVHLLRSLREQCEPA